MFIGYRFKCSCCHKEFLTIGRDYERSKIGITLLYEDLCPTCDATVVAGVRAALTVCRGGLEVVGHTTPLGVVTTDQPTNQPNLVDKKGDL